MSHDKIKARMLWLKRIGKAARYKWAERKLMLGLCLQIRAMREHRNWTMQELAKQAGIHLITVYRLEKFPWSCWPTINTLLKLAAAFDVVLIVRFVSWSEFVAWAEGIPQTNKGLSTSALCPKSFSEEFGQPGAPPSATGEAQKVLDKP